MAQLLSGSTGNLLLESGSVVIGSLVKHVFWDEIGVVTEQIDSGSHVDSRFWVYSYKRGKGVYFGTYLEALELLQINTGSLKV
jgi:hypothetical protein